MADYNPTPEQEQAWEQEKQYHYEKWRQDKLALCVQWVKNAKNSKERWARIEAIRERLGRPGEGFMKDLWYRLRD